VRVDSLIKDPEHAGALLKQYFQDVEWTTLRGFTGAWFERFDGGGDRNTVAGRFTTEDLTAVTMLSVNVPPRAAWLLVTDPGGTFSRLLTEIPAGRTLADATDEDITQGSELYDVILWMEHRRDARAP
jgi:hypothetical protein